MSWVGVENRWHLRGEGDIYLSIFFFCPRILVTVRYYFMVFNIFFFFCQRLFVVLFNY